MSQIEIFKTNVNNNSAAQKVVLHLSQDLPDYEFNFDLDDCDNVLRVMGSSINIERISRSMNQLGYECEVIF
jgi:hypothetical protein